MTNFRKSASVTWKWSAQTAEGEIAGRFDQNDGGRVLKSQPELSRRQPPQKLPSEKVAGPRSAKAGPVHPQLFLTSVGEWTSTGPRTPCSANR